MVPLSALSRRALVAAAALAAVTPAAAAKKKNKKKKPPPPLAFAGVAITDASPSINGTAFLWTFQGSLSHPASSTASAFSGTIGVEVEATTTQVRAQIASILKGAVSHLLSLQGETVPEDRIAVVLF